MITKNINSTSGKKYEEITVPGIVYDDEPIEGSFNGITSDAVAKIAGGVADLDSIVPEDASEENKLATAADVAGVQEDVDTIEGKIPSDTSTTNKLVNESGLQDAIDNASESWSTGFTPKGESSVSDLNGLTTQSNGDSYIVTDSGTLTDGSLAVVAGDQVAWDATNSVWYKLPQYALNGSLENLSNSIEKEFSTEKNYSAGEVVLNNNNVLYKFFADHPAGVWTDSDAVETNVARESNRVDKLWTQGYRIHPNGSLVAGEGYEYSDYIVIPEDGLFVSCHLFSYSCIAFYDASKKFIGSHSVESGPNILHEETLTRNAFEGAAYIRVTNYYTGYKGRGVWKASIENSQSAVSQGFVSTKKYLAGENAVVNGNLVRFFADHEPGNFDWTDAVSTIVTNEINRVDSKWTQGHFLNSAGTETAMNGYEYSDYIAIPYNGLKVTTSVFENTGVAYYNASKQFIGFKAGTGAVNSVHEFVVTREDFENAVYIRADNYRGVSTGSYNLRRVNTLNLMYNVNTESNEYCRYTGGEASTFNKGVAIGDSLTSGTFNYNYPDGQLIHVIEDAKYSWPTFFKKLSGVDMTNKGHGGATPESWYASHSSDDLSGHDFAVIALGVNCAFHDHGGWTSDSDEALKNIIAKLENENEGIKIFVCTIFASTSYTGDMMDSISEGIRTSVAEIQETDDNVYLLDLDEYGTTKQTKYWHGHATATGYERIAKDVFNYISYVMSQNMDEFKFVQFIGTNYEP